MGCDIRTHAHAQDSLYNTFVQTNSTAGSLYNLFGQGYGCEYHSSEKLAGLAGELSLGDLSGKDGCPLRKLGAVA